MFTRLVAVLPLFLCLQVHTAETPALPAELQKTASRLVALALEDNTGYKVVESLTTEVGPRLAGTEAEARARSWAVSKLKSLGFSNVRIEEFPVRAWERVSERAEITAPYPQPLMITALGGSVSTPGGGVEGEVVSLPSLPAMQTLADGALKGKIAFIDEMMVRSQDGYGYAWAGRKRREAAYEAHRLGASAVLIRSVGTSNHRFPHTGQMHRATDPVVPSVPAAALSAPDADQLARALNSGKPVSVRVAITTRTGKTATSGNVIAEIPGREHPEEIVLIGAHLDSWDLGTGAVDDGAGVGITVGAARLIKDELSEAPKRTIRVVLFGSEEVGLVGAKAYAEKHADEMDNHIVATESDFGAAEVWRFDTRVAEAKLPLTAAIYESLRPLDIVPGNNRASGGPDIKFIQEAGVPVVRLVQNGWDYFDLHHTPDDTLDKIDPAKLAQNVAAYVALTYLVAEMDGDFR